jgi:hypothetical protein
VPEIALLSGTAGLSANGLDGAMHKVWAHSFDYDTYLAANAETAPPLAPYAVFLDEDMIYHSDFDHSEIKSPATAEAYYRSMNGFFDKLEREWGMPVTVAAHPRSRSDSRSQQWGDRTIVHGRTAQLVRDAKLVLCHQSTAVSFAVMWRKPLIFLTTDELVPSYLQPRIALGSALLRSPLVNVDGDTELPPRESLFAVDEAAYAKYAEAYIKRLGTPTQPVWQIFSEYVQRELVG